LAPWQFPNLARLHTALKVGAYARHHRRKWFLKTYPRAADLLRSRRVEALLDDSRLIKAVRADRYDVTLADARVRRLLDDEQFSNRLAKMDWSTMWKEIRHPH